MAAQSLDDADLADLLSPLRASDERCTKKRRRRAAGLSAETSRLMKAAPCSC